MATKAEFTGGNMIAYNAVKDAKSFDNLLEFSEKNGGNIVEMTIKFPDGSYATYRKNDDNKLVFMCGMVNIMPEKA